MFNSFRDLASLFVFLLNLAVFLLPGFAVVLTIAQRREISAIHSLITLVTSSAAVGYVAFWIFFQNRLVGKLFSFTCLAASALVIAFALGRGPSAKALLKKLAVPLGYVAVVGICYLCWFYLFNNPLRSGPDLANVRFFADVRPGDNLIPMIFAEKIYNREPLKPFCCGDWLSSDRPPLQAGIYLFERPLRLIGAGVSDQLLGTSLQCLWICGVWTLLQSLRAPSRLIKQILGFLVFSGFSFYNSLYIWPKLLAATFILFVASLLFDLRYRRHSFTFFETTLAAGSFSLAIMAHPGCVFSLPGLLLLVASRRKWATVRQCAFAVALIGVFVLPWMAYQKFYDPPGNRLLKMHLAGVPQIDSRSTWQALADAYRKPSLRALASYRWANLKGLFGPKMFDGLGLTAVRLGPPVRVDQPVSEATRVLERDYMWNAMGILNMGWLAALICLVRRRSQTPLPHSGLLISITLLNLIVWSLVMYLPGYTITATSSYADILLLSIGLLGFLLTLPRFAILLLFALQIFNLFVVWVWSLPNLPSAARELQWPFLIVGLCSTAALAGNFGRSYFEPLLSGRNSSGPPRENAVAEHL